jgi:hypothetical protein
LEAQGSLTDEQSIANMFGQVFLEEQSSIAKGDFTAFNQKSSRLNTIIVSFYLNKFNGQGQTEQLKEAIKKVMGEFAK